MFEPHNPQRKKQRLNVKIRAATESDIMDIVDISIDRESGDRKQIYASVKSYVANMDESFVMVAIVKNQVVGFGKAKQYIGDAIEYPGWYLTGLIVRPAYRNGNIGTLLTIDRLKKIEQVAAEAYYFANATNIVSIELHKKLGFRLEREPFLFPHVSFSNSHGQLYRRNLDD